MKKVIFTSIVLIYSSICFAQSTTAGRFTNNSVSKFKEQMQFSEEQSVKLDSIFAAHYAAQNVSDTAPPLCLRAKDAEILSLLTPQQQDKYDILKQEWKSRHAADKRRKR
jgi:hypothetical protein